MDPLGPFKGLCVGSLWSGYEDVRGIEYIGVQDFYQKGHCRLELNPAECGIRVSVMSQLLRLVLSTYSRLRDRSACVGPPSKLQYPESPIPLDQGIYLKLQCFNLMI